MEDKRTLVLRTLDNQEADRVPVGFWFHYLKDETIPYSPEAIQINLDGHQKYFDEFQPDFVKLMSDGFFNYPNETAADIFEAADLAKIESGRPEVKKWIDDQVAHVKELTGRFGSQVATFYNVFSPVTYLSLLLNDHFTFQSIPRLFKEDREALKKALLVIAEDVSELASRVIKEGGADGIYLSVGCFTGISRAQYLDTFAPAEIEVLKNANEESTYNMIHICGYEGRRNDLTTFADYPVKAVNWAAVVEGIPLEEGRKIFGEKAIIGGFANTTTGVLYAGTKEEITAEVQKILSAVGTKGVILGADCTIPRGTPIEHLKWVREAAKEFGK